jgi:DNA-binding NarL/FixJ family response regulator
VSEVPPRALVVEDERSWQLIFAELLSDAGMAVDVVGSAADAVAALRSTSHRLAVVDLSLDAQGHHNQDGLTVLESLRVHDPTCVSLLVTGYATVELAVSALTTYGAYTCLRKEAFRRSEFRSLVSRALAVAPIAPSITDPVNLLQPIQVGAAQSTVHETDLSPILLVEDDAGWSSLLRELLGDIGRPIDACASFGEALGLMRRRRYSLAVVDLSLANSTAPDSNRDGYRVLARAQASHIPAIAVSGMADAGEIERAYSEYGIFGYAEKQSFQRAAFVRLVNEALNSVADRDGPLATLTAREREVLELLVQGLSNKEIAASLMLSPNTVKRYLKTIFAKLDVDTRSAAVAKVLA